MDSRHTDSLRRRKHRLASALVAGGEEEFWDCTVCTYKNSAEAFRCEMCQTRKGTSTRKPKLNRQIVEEQNLIARAIIKERQEESGATTGGTESSAPHRRRYHRHLNNNGSASASVSALKHVALLRPGSLRNVDRSCPQHFEVFANGFSVVITEYYPKASSPATTPGGSKQVSSLSNSPALSTPASLVGSTSIPLGTGAAKVENTSHSDHPTANHLPTSPSSTGVASGDHPRSTPLNDSTAISNGEEVEEEGKAKDHLDVKEPHSDEEGFNGASLTSPLIAPKSEVTEAPVESLMTAMTVSCRRKRRKRRLRSDTSTNNSPRSLRSSTGSSAVASRSRQASRIARASLYRVTSAPRSYKRRKIATSSATTSVEVTSSSDLTSPINTESTAPMTDSCGAVALEMSTASAST
ncbi:YY1-associated factor 2 [Taenia solium]|eukprot:TsM_000047500 transcript=TsM_000047500 gene=TsM_000047500